MKRKRLRFFGEKMWRINRKIRVVYTWIDCQSWVLVCLWGIIRQTEPQCRYNGGCQAAIIQQQTHRAYVQEFKTISESDAIIELFLNNLKGSWDAEIRRLPQMIVSLFNRKRYELTSIHTNEKKLVKIVKICGWFYSDDAYPMFGPSATQIKRKESWKSACIRVRTWPWGCR